MSTEYTSEIVRRVYEEASLDHELRPDTPAARTWRDLTPEREDYNELVQIGLQASLPFVGGEFVALKTGNNSPGGVSESLLTIANTPYQQMPEAEKDVLSGMSRCLLSYLVQVVDMKLPIDEKMYQLGREFIYEGYVHGKDGAPSGVYSFDILEERRRLKWLQEFGLDVSPEVVERLSEPGQADRFMLGGSYHETTHRQEALAYENVINLGFLSLRNRQLFTLLYWTGDLTYHDNAYIDNDPGIREGELRGRAAVNRVTRVTGEVTELQRRMLLSRDIDATRQRPE